MRIYVWIALFLAATIIFNVQVSTKASCDGCYEVARVTIEYINGDIQDAVIPIHYCLLYGFDGKIQKDVDIRDVFF